jgi:peptidoglycan/LPS O-acetylase OafA/YrhL
MQPRVHAPMPPSAQGSFGNHLSSLDGLRAFSIVLVFICHGAAGSGHTTSLTNYLGPLGVTIFFVISGTLITWLMLREKEETGVLSLQDFYVRRALRILPLFWLLILCVLALRSLHLISISGWDIFRAFTFTHDYPFRAHGEYAWWLGHTWSLSVEEQFYLLWPSLFALLPRKKSMALAGTIAFSGPVLLLASYYLLPFFRSHEGFMFHTRVDALMMGCFAAYLLDSPRWRERIKKIPAGPVLLASSLFVLAVVPYALGCFPLHSLARNLVTLIMPSLSALAIAASLLTLVAGKTGIVHALFNQPAVAHLGKLSYSLYIWQQLLLSPYSISTVPSLLWRVLAIYGMSLCSFNLVEMPFLKLRKKFRRVQE